MPGTGSRAKKKSKPPDQEEQSQRFIETAKKLEADESGRDFQEAIKAIASPSRKKQDLKK